MPEAEKAEELHNSKKKPSKSKTRQWFQSHLGEKLRWKKPVSYAVLGKSGITSIF